MIRDGVIVADGHFSVKLDFGSQFPGANRFLQISVRQQPNIHTQLSPRQQMNSTPYAIKSLNSENAAVATNTLQLGGIAANQYVLTVDARLSDARAPLPGSSNYIQNSTPGAGFGFNINGQGSAEFLNAGQYFSIGSFRVLSIAGSRNAFVGQNTGTLNSGADNAFFGANAGATNQTGTRNSFFGSDAGRNNSTGGFNSFGGAGAGENNTTGTSNSFFGNAAGLFNTTGIANVYFGDGAGALGTTATNNTIVGTAAGFNNTGSNNTFVGSRSGGANTTGVFNTFAGQGAGQNNSTASYNAFFGGEAGMSITTAAGNAFFGGRAGKMTTGAQNSFFGTDAGASNTVGKLNSFFGFQSGTGNTGDQNAFFGERTGILNTGSFNAFFGQAAGNNNTGGSTNTFIGWFAGSNNTTGGNNTFVGSLAAFNGGLGNTGGNTLIGADTKVDPGVSASTAIGFGATVSTSNLIVIGRLSETTRVPGSFTSGYFRGVSGIPSLRALDSPAGGGVIAPNLYLTGFSQLSSPNHLCWRAVVDGAIQGNALTNCTGAFGPERFKQNVRSFTGGLNVIRRLRPIAFEWKADGMSDRGLNVEDVASVDPDLVTRNAEGQAESVKEHSLEILFINAINEQQAQIEASRQLITQMQLQIAELKIALCAANPKSDVCSAPAE